MKKLIFFILLFLSVTTFSQSNKSIGDNVLVATNDKKDIIFYRFVDEMGLEGFTRRKTYWYILKTDKPILLFKNISPIDMVKWLDKNKFKLIKL